MAHFVRHGEGWRAQVARRGVRKSATFPSKGAAVVWAGKIEAEIMAGHRGEVPDLPVSDLLKRYKREVSIHKKGRRWEEVRLDALERDRLAKVRLRHLDTPHLSDWQQRRLQDVSAASVRRERNLLNNVFNVAVWEWKWLAKNPFGERGKAIRRPKDGKPRDRLVTQAELAEVMKQLSPSMRQVVTLALETGMRAGELAALLPSDLNGRVLKVRDSKTGSGREVPLSQKALDALVLPLGLSSGSISTLWARACEDAKVENLTFHDLRHAAAIRISKKLDAWELCKMFGWKDPRVALNTYYKADVESMADKL